MKNGLYIALQKFSEKAIELADKMIYYFDKKTAIWMSEDGYCEQISGMPVHLNNLRCLAVS